MVTRIVVAVALIAGCKFDTGNFGDRSCVAETDCRPDEDCRDSLCAQNDCAEIIDCGPGYEYSCQDGGCVVRPCVNTEDCGLAYSCTGGFCAQECTGSDRDSDAICDDVDNCPDDANRQQLDSDGDLSGDACDVCRFDEDDDADGDQVCADLDNCPFAPNPLQLDTDSDNAGNDCDSDDDNDGLVDLNDLAPTNPNVCGDADMDTCDDCTIGTDGFGPLSDSTPNSDGTDTDIDGDCDQGDPDDDNDGRLDGPDVCPIGDTGWTSNTTTDFDGDGCRDVSEDLDDDNDGIGDPMDPDDRNADICGDSDSDTCDDCFVGTDGIGPMSDSLPQNDGPDTDFDGRCNASDTCQDVDGDGLGNGTGGNAMCVNPTNDSNDSNPLVCADTDGDLCNDCTSGAFMPLMDGLDTDMDALGLCNNGDPDDDNDGVDDGPDPAPLDPQECGVDSDADLCDDCTVGVDGFGPMADARPAMDGTDVDMDGMCGLSDCDDTKPNCTTDCTDLDEDDFCAPQDCNECLDTCGADCTTDADGDSVANCVEVFCGSDGPGGTCRIVTDETSLNLAIAAANTAGGHDYLLLNASFSVTLDPANVSGTDGVTIRQCEGTAVTVTGAVDRVLFDLDGNASAIEGVEMTSPAGGNANMMIRIAGANNTVIDSKIIGYERNGIFITGTGNTIMDNLIRGGTLASANGFGGVAVSGSSADNNVIVGNVIAFNAHDGINIDEGDITFIDHNTISNNTGDGIEFLGSSSTNCMRNNIVSSNTGAALRNTGSLTWATTSCTSPLTPAGAPQYGNDQYLNTGGLCAGSCASCSCIPGGTPNQGNFWEFNVNPNFVSTSETSPAYYCPQALGLINTMDVLGYDVNGDDPGQFNPTAPDGGGRETGSDGCP